MIVPAGNPGNPGFPLGRTTPAGHDYDVQSSFFVGSSVARPTKVRADFSAPGHDAHDKEMGCIFKTIYRFPSFTNIHRGMEILPFLNQISAFA